jgi:hypothetical protein
VSTCSTFFVAGYWNFCADADEAKNASARAKAASRLKRICTLFISLFFFGISAEKAGKTLTASLADQPRRWAERC